MDDAIGLLPAAHRYSGKHARSIVLVLLRLFRRWRVRSRRRNELAGLSPYLLEDIGITAAEAQRESEREPWEAPMLRSSNPTQPREDR